MTESIEILNAEWKNHIQNNRLWLLMDFNEGIVEFLSNFRFEEPYYMEGGEKGYSRWEVLVLHEACDNSITLEIKNKVYLPKAKSTIFLLGSYQYNESEVSPWVVNAPDGRWLYASGFMDYLFDEDIDSLNSTIETLFQDFDLRKKIEVLAALKNEV